MSEMAAISSYAQRCGPAARSSARYSNASPTVARPAPACQTCVNLQVLPCTCPLAATKLLQGLCVCMSKHVHK